MLKHSFYSHVVHYYVIKCKSFKIPIKSYLLFYSESNVLPVRIHVEPATKS